MTKSLLNARIYVDTNVFIYAIERNTEYSEQAKQVLSCIDEGYVFAVTSELSLAEVLVKPLKEQNTADISLYEEIVKNRRHFDVRPISRNVLRQAAALQAETGNKLPDCIHLASALTSQCSIFVTQDLRMKPTTRMQHLSLVGFGHLYTQEFL